MTYQNPPGFQVPDPRYNDPLAPEYVRRASRQTEEAVDGLVKPILESDHPDAMKLMLLERHLLNALLVFHAHAASYYYSFEPDPSFKPPDQAQ